MNSLKSLKIHTICLPPSHLPAPRTDQGPPALVQRPPCQQELCRGQRAPSNSRLLRLNGYERGLCVLKVSKRSLFSPLTNKKQTKFQFLSLAQFICRYYITQYFHEEFKIQINCDFFPTFPSVRRLGSGWYLNIKDIFLLCILIFSLTFCSS